PTNRTDQRTKLYFKVMLVIVPNKIASATYIFERPNTELESRLITSCLLHPPSDRLRKVFSLLF
ncbi:MAG: hypothetical protein QXR31_06380, partial [Zestosphaera sp.]